MSIFKFAVPFLAFFFFFTTSAQAKLDDQSEKLQPCMQIKKACEGAGLSRLKIKVKDCMQKITNGESIEGVQVSADVVNGCKEKHEK